jgi:hypothetical protein
MDLIERAIDSSDLVARPLALEPTPPLSKTISRLSVLTAVVASQTYLIRAAFFAHSLTPIGVFVIDRQTHLHLASGQVGSIEEVFHWDGMILTMVISILVFVVAWAVTRRTATLFARSSPRKPARPAERYFLAPVILATDTLTVSTGVNL